MWGAMLLFSPEKTSAAHGLIAPAGYRGFFMPYRRASNLVTRSFRSI